MNFSSSLFQEVIKWYSWLLFNFSFFFVVMIAIIILHVVFGMSLSQDTPSCNCKNDFGMVYCYNVRACPEFVTIARVECAIKEIIVKPNTSLDQVLTMYQHIGVQAILHASN